MKVLFIARATLFTNRGGDTIQIVKTAAHLADIGIDVEIKLTTEKIDYTKYDLLHLFNITRPADILFHIKASKKVFVLSPVFVEYAEYDRNVRTGVSGLFFKLLSPDAIEYTKALARAILKGEKLKSSDFIWLGQRKAIRRILQKASLLLPNSENEYRRLLRSYQVEKIFAVVPNAVEEFFLNQSESPVSRDPTLVICVARIEGLKNQLNLIRALNNTKFTLLIIGNPTLNQMNYYHQCKQEAGNNIRFIGYLSQEQLLKYYRQATVHILPSWFETTGLSSLEAAACGCNIVITDKGDTREYFADYATYCEPASVDSIFKAVEKASALPANGFREIIKNRYIWNKTATITAQAYEKVLNLKT
ncbi:MAG TPA: glycosyltransferase family 4 protein [Flavitalea sp.]|nr:glycosyltransferase family 4 protein [Flavitalea sp.]